MAALTFNGMVSNERQAVAAACLSVGIMVAIYGACEQDKEVVITGLAAYTIGVNIIKACEQPIRSTMTQSEEYAYVKTKLSFYAKCMGYGTVAGIAAVVATRHFSLFDTVK